MTWERRLRELFIAGGAAAALGCSSSTTDGNVPCGNANPDPCICGRPQSSPEEAALCDQETACKEAGGVFDPTTCGNCASDGGVLPPHCDMPDAGTAGSDGG